MIVLLALLSMFHPHFESEPGGFSGLAFVLEERYCQLGRFHDVDPEVFEGVRRSQRPEWSLVEDGDSLVGIVCYR